MPKAHQIAMKSHFQSKNQESGDKSSPSCVICSSKHYLDGCPQYISRTTQQRYSILTKHGRCYNCLGAHRVSDCRSTKRCTKCGRKHHTTIHQQISLNKENNLASTKATAPQESVTTAGSSQFLHLNTSSDHATSCVLLATTQVVIINQKGRILQIRALIDQEVTLITERVVQTLRFPRTHSCIPLIGVGGQSSYKTRGFTSFKVTTIHENAEQLELSAHILTKLTNTIPSFQIDMQHWPHLNGLTLTDPHFLQPFFIC